MTENLNLNEFLTAKEAANFLDITPDRLRYLRRQGRVKGVRAGYNETLYLLSDLRKADTKERKKGRKPTERKEA